MIGGRAALRWCVLLLGTSTVAAAVRAQVTVAVSAPATVAAGAPVLVRVEVTAPATAGVRLAPPTFAPFRVVRTDRAAADTSGLNGRQRLDWRFVLQTNGAGTYAFEPFEADVQGAGLRRATFRSRTWSVAVAPGPVSPSAPIGGSDLAPSDPGRLSFDARVAPERVYVGQQATLALRVVIGTRVRERLRRSPEFNFPTVGGVVGYDLSAGHASSAGADVHVYRRALFPLAPGTVEIPAAQLLYGLTPDGDPFGTEERVVTRSPVRQLTVVAPPVEGRPAIWDGAVGQYRASAHADTAHARVGDAVVYTLRIAGSGNVMLLPRPALNVPWADVSPAAERVMVDSTGDAAGGAKEFDWLLTPRTAGPARVPAVRYAYFDPTRATYAYADAPAVDLRVAPGAIAATPSRAVAERQPSAMQPGLGVRRAWGGDAAPNRATTRGFWLALAAVPGPAVLWLLATAAFARVRRRPPTDRGRRAGASGTARDPARAHAADALSEFATGFASLLGVTDMPVVDARITRRALRRAGIGRALADACGDAVDRWLQVAYGTMGGDPATDRSPALTPRELLDRVARELGTPRTTSATPPRGSAIATSRAPAVPRTVWAAAAVCVAAVALAFAVPGVDAHPALARRSADLAQALPAFDAGVAAYAAGDAARARDLFVVAAASAPAAPAAWLNAGTAAWATSDTATAAFAWQRAMRLDPDLPGLGARLERLPPNAGGLVEGPIPIDPATASRTAELLAAAATFGLLVTAVARARPRALPAVTRVAPASVVAYVAAVALGGIAAAGVGAGDVRGVAVVRSAGALRSEPAVEAPPEAAVATGEVARLVADEGGWVHLRLDGDRDGWLRSTQVAPLDGLP